MEGQEGAETPAAPGEAPPAESTAPTQPAPAPSTEVEAQDVSAGEPLEGHEEAEGARPPTKDQPTAKPVTHVRCSSCRTAIPIFSAQRPLVVTCPQCGRMGMLK